MIPGHTKKGAANLCFISALLFIRQNPFIKWFPGLYVGHKGCGGRWLEKINWTAVFWGGSRRQRDTVRTPYWDTVKHEIIGISAMTNTCLRRDPRTEVDKIEEFQICQ